MLKKDKKGVLYKRVIHNKWKKVEPEDLTDNTANAHTNAYRNSSSFVDANDSLARVLSVVILAIGIMLVVFSDYLIRWKFYDFPYNYALAFYKYTLYEPLSSVPAVFKFLVLNRVFDTTWLQVIWAIFFTMAYLITYFVLWFVAYQGLARVFDKYGINRIFIIILYLLPLVILLQGWVSDGI